MSNPRHDEKGRFAIAFTKRTGEKGYVKDAITGKPKIHETKESAEAGAQSMRNWARNDYKNQGRRLTQYGVVEWNTHKSK